MRLIVGSVGKAQNSPRSVDPATEDIRPGWKRAFAVAQGLRGYEPIELYEEDRRCYVVDGHYRVSVAKTLGNDTMQAAGPSLAWTSTDQPVRATIPAEMPDRWHRHTGGRHVESPSTAPHSTARVADAASSPISRSPNY